MSIMSARPQHSENLRPKCLIRKFVSRTQLIAMSANRPRISVGDRYRDKYGVRSADSWDPKTEVPAWKARSFPHERGSFNGNRGSPCHGSH